MQVFQSVERLNREFDIFDSDGYQIASASNERYAESVALGFAEPGDELVFHYRNGRTHSVYL